jgi:hypothetical protein
MIALERCQYCRLPRRSPIKEIYFNISPGCLGNGHDIGHCQCGNIAVDGDDGVSGAAEQLGRAINGTKRKRVRTLAKEVVKRLTPPMGDQAGRGYDSTLHAFHEGMTLHERPVSRMVRWDVHCVGLPYRVSHHSGNMQSAYQDGDVLSGIIAEKWLMKKYFSYIIHIDDIE